MSPLVLNLDVFTTLASFQKKTIIGSFLGNNSLLKDKHFIFWNLSFRLPPQIGQRRPSEHILLIDTTV